MAAPIPGEAPFDSPMKVDEEIDRLVKAGLTCEERLCQEMLADLRTLERQDCWRGVAARLEGLAAETLVEYWPIDRDASDLGQVMSVSDARSRLARRYGQGEIDIVSIDALGRLVRDRGSSTSFLGVDLTPFGRDRWWNSIVK